MRLFEFPERPAQNAPYVTWYRWVVDGVASRSWPGLALEASMEVQGAKETKWRRGYDYMSITLTHHWHWGEYHAYYDGCHCCFSIGFIHLNWTNSDCEKCLEMC